jgi:DNA invertase Pin-like site-specific DNA recombinase
LQNHFRTLHQLARTLVLIGAKRRRDKLLFLGYLRPVTTYYMYPEQTSDTHTPMGKCMYYVASAFAEMERDILLERTQAGLLAARARGRQGGRPKALTGKKAAMVKELYENKHLTINL